MSIVHIVYLNHSTIIVLPLEGPFKLVDKHLIFCIFFSDLLKNPLIVPVKILKGHTISRDLGVLDCVFHPNQPWVFSCGADTTIRLFTWYNRWISGGGQRKILYKTYSVHNIITRTAYGRGGAHMFILKLLILATVKTIWSLNMNSLCKLSIYYCY